MSETEPETGADGAESDPGVEPVESVEPESADARPVGAESDSGDEWFETERFGPSGSRSERLDAAESDLSGLPAKGFETKPVKPERRRDAGAADASAERPESDGGDPTPEAGTSPDRPAGEFAALYDYLVEHERDRVERSFAELEVVLEAQLPTEARRWQRWWTNAEASHPHSGAWLRAGYEVTAVSLPEGRVTFERVAADEPSPGSVESPPAGRVSPRRPE